MRKRLAKKFNPPPQKRTPLEEAMHAAIVKLDDDMTENLFATAHPLALNSNHPPIRPLSSDSAFIGADFATGPDRAINLLCGSRFYDSMFKPVYIMELL